MSAIVSGVVIAIMGFMIGYLARVHFNTLAKLDQTRIAFATERVARDMADDRLETITNALNASNEKVLILETELSRLKIEYAFTQSRRVARAAPVLDAQTSALVRLATSNPSEHERNAAAALVCKRLRQKLDK